MAYSNDIEQMRAGLINYIGAIQQVVPFEGHAKNQIVASILMDEILDVARTEPKNPYCDPYILVPLFKGVIGVLKQQQVVLMKNPVAANRERVIRYEAMIEEFEKLLKENTPETKDVPDTK